MDPELQRVVWQAYQLVTTVFALASAAIVIADCPFNVHEFKTIPVEVQKEFDARAFLYRDNYTNRLAAIGMKKPRADLHLHMKPQRCERGENPENLKSWPEEITQIFCASKDYIKWCEDNNKYYMATENVYPLGNGFNLHASAVCFRIESFPRFLDDNGTAFHIVTGILSLIYLIGIRVYGLKIHPFFLDQLPAVNVDEDAEEEQPATRRSRRQRNQSGSGSPPIANIGNRNENYRNRRR